MQVQDYGEGFSSALLGAHMASRSMHTDILFGKVCSSLPFFF